MAGMPKDCRSNPGHVPDAAGQSAGGVGIARAAGEDDARSPPAPSAVAGTAARTSVMPSGSTRGPGIGAAGTAAADALAAGRSGSGAGTGALSVTAAGTAGAAGRGGGAPCSPAALAAELAGAAASVPPLLSERGCSSLSAPPPAA
jgi:hypothetical protein